MKISEMRDERDRALAALLLERFRSDVDDIPMVELFGLFQEHGVAEDAAFHSYEAFVRWLKGHQELTVELGEGTGRGVLVLKMDERAAGYTEARTGEAIYSGEFRPYGDLSYCLDAEVAP